MGEIVVDVRLNNWIDAANAESGGLNPADVRSVELRAIADTGARLLTLPEDVAAELSLQQLRTSTALFADGRRAVRPIMGMLEIRIGDRQMVGECLVVPAGADPLIGQVVLETVDLIVDCANQTLTPRPESPDLPLTL